jgi:cytochrome c553
MKTTRCLAMAIAIAALGAGCATTDRSRSLGNAAIPAITLAQQVCSNCHGLDGNSVSPNFPRLAGQQEAYTVSQLSGFRNHHRSDPAGFEYMWGLSKHLTDAQIQGLAAYFAAQAPAAQATGAVAPAALGKEIFEQGIAAKAVPPCGSCHGAQGQGNGAFPRLAGQHSDYLVKQLLVFQRTDERPEGAVMKTVAHLLTRADMVEVAAYLQGLAPAR